MLNKKHIPNLLTVGRALAVPLALAYLVFWPGNAFPLFVIFVAASVTDFFDGYLARKWNAESAFGAMLDPIADKLLVATLLLYLVTYTYAPMLPIAVILLREIYISGLREFLALRGVAMPVSKGGKLKTTLQMLAIALLLGSMAFQVTHRLPAQHGWNIGIAVLWVSALLSLLTALDYTRKALPALKA